MQMESLLETAKQTAKNIFAAFIPENTNTQAAEPKPPAPLNPPVDGCIWIVGASSGIGEAVARRMAKDGWTVAVSARRAENLEAMAADSASWAGKIVSFPLDVMDTKAVQKTAKAIESQCGVIHRALLCAGMFVQEDITTFASKTFQPQFELNVMSVVHCLETILPNMQSRKSGYIGIISSVAGYRGLPTSYGYSASKAALISLAESLKVDLHPYNIRVQVINPGFIKTPMTDKNTFPMPFLMPVDEAAACVVEGMDRNTFELSFPKEFTLGMQVLRILPSFLYFPLMTLGAKKFYGKLAAKTVERGAHTHDGHGKQSSETAVANDDQKAA